VSARSPVSPPVSFSQPPTLGSVLRGILSLAIRIFSILPLVYSYQELSETTMPRQALGQIIVYTTVSSLHPRPNRWDESVCPSPVCRGILLDRRLLFGKHIEAACEKTRKVMRALCSVLPNVRGATANKRRVMAMATQSIILYGAPIWYPAMNIGRHRERVISTQRIMALRTCVLCVSNCVDGCSFAYRRACAVTSLRQGTEAEVT
jgi:hypothetical protein